MERFTKLVEGGLIGLILALISLIAIIICLFLGNTTLLIICGFSVILLRFIPINFSNIQWYFAGFIVNVVVFSVVGILIGWLVGKFKTKKE